MIDRTVPEELREARAAMLIDDLKLCTSLPEYLGRAKEILKLGYDVFFEPPQHPELDRPAGGPAMSMGRNNHVG